MSKAMYSMYTLYKNIVNCQEDEITALTKTKINIGIDIIRTVLACQSVLTHR